MYVKITNGEIEQFPYTLGDFRRDNQNTSFPKVISGSILRRNGVFFVSELDKPYFSDMTQILVQGELPHKEGNDWLIGYSVENKTPDEAKTSIRENRNDLIEDTDKMALTDRTLSPEWATYRQELRDITDQEGFPYSVTFPTKPE
jgi:hypothetical protein